MLQDVVRRLLKARRIPSAEQGVQQDVIGLEGGIGLEFAAPVAVFVLLGEKITAGGINGGAYSASKFVYFSEQELGR